MRLKTVLFPIILLFTFSLVKAQVIAGKILDDSTAQPVIATVITASGYHTSTNSDGEFTIHTSGIGGDTVRISAVGYRAYMYLVRVSDPGYLIIRIKQAPISLKDVVIKAARNHIKDSIELRKEYSNIFNYQPTKIKDVFSPPPSDVPFAFVSVNLLKVLSVLTRNNDPKYRLKKELLMDEQGSYIATRFNRGLVTETTGLKGDSLNKFMEKYYPAFDWVKKSSDYDIIMYIKTKATELRKEP
ncbi:MAG TPA: carboxypeptidase-like regulatory domain-containing protein [Mucilaginibacter sp.]|nr:carboxypeptidase-like regulatory domain-containing protein [Mucilaginibacter sp.]